MQKEFAMPLPREQLVSFQTRLITMSYPAVFGVPFSAVSMISPGKALNIVGIDRRPYPHTFIYFTIDICAYAVMSNHYHIVVKLNPDEASHWSMDEVFNRWCALYKGPLLIRKYLDGEDISQAEIGYRKGLKPCIVSV